MAAAVEPIQANPITQKRKLRPRPPKQSSSSAAAASSPMVDSGGSYYNWTHHCY